MMSDRRPHQSSSGDFFEELGQMQFPLFGATVTAADLFTRGACHQLAIALASIIPDGRVVSVCDQMDEDGTPLADPRLIHAGLLVHTDILDIEGAFDPSDWIERWSAQARAPVVVEWDSGDIPYGFISDAHEETSFQVAERISSWMSEVYPRHALRASAPHAH